MNQIELNLKTMIQTTVKNVFDHELALDDIVIELPKDKAHGDYATNVAMRLTKTS
jgi:arginyl-tRNA synthetase